MASWSYASPWIPYVGSTYQDSPWHSQSVSVSICVASIFSLVLINQFTCFRLAYLHEAIEPKVVHRDVKSSNILIDDDFNAKVSDFGLAKLLGAGKSYVTTRVMGTFGSVILCSAEVFPCSVLLKFCKKKLFLFSFLL